MSNLLINIITLIIIFTYTLEGNRFMVLTVSVIKGFYDYLTKTFDSSYVNKRIDNLEQRIDNLEQRMGVIEERIENVENKLDEILYLLKNK